MNSDYYIVIPKKQIIEYNPINSEEIFFIYDLIEIKINDKNIIKALFYNNKSFDLWIKKEKEIINYKIINKFDNIKIAI